MFDFAEMEARFEAPIHSSIKEYFNSYWFLDVDASHSQFASVGLYSVEPGEQTSRYEKTLTEYRKWWGDREDAFAPIGRSGNNDVFVVHGETGEVHFMWDTQSPNPRYLAPSLADFIDALQPFVLPK